MTNRLLGILGALALALPTATVLAGPAQAALSQPMLDTGVALAPTTAVLRDGDAGRVEQIGFFHHRGYYHHHRHGFFHHHRHHFFHRHHHHFFHHGRRHFF